VNAREKEQYLREYHVFKGQGKPFFPYTVFKDGTMATLTLVVIIAAAILFGAELGPKADPTTTTYTPRPEWYFFFLFELLRVVKPPALVFMATVGIPTICLVLLIILPFIDRNPERNPLKRPIATLTGITVIAAMAYLTIEGAIAGSPTEIEMKVAKQYEPGRAVAASSGCLGCHKIGDNGNAGPGPPLTPTYSRLKQRTPKEFNELVNFLSSLR